MEEIKQITLSICVFDTLVVSSVPTLLIIVVECESVSVLSWKVKEELKILLDRENSQGNSAYFSKEKVREIIGDCYTLAEIIIDEFLERK